MVEALGNPADKPAAMLTDASLQAMAERAGLWSYCSIVAALGGPTHAEVEPDRYLYPASMIKTPLCAAALVLVESGELHLGNLVEVIPGNMTANDAASPLVPGYRARLDELVDLAIRISDNVATNMLFDVVGRARATRIVRERFGLAQTAFHRKLSGSDPLIADPDWDGVSLNAHGVRDAARLFELIARDEVPLADRLREALAHQTFNVKLSAGLREGDTFAHKTGDTSEVTHDGGILTTADGKTYVVVAYTGMASTDEHNARFAPFMRELRALL